MGHGGGIINRNLTLTVITLLALVLFVNVSAVSAANTTTADADSIIKSSDTVKNYVETKKTVPKHRNSRNKKGNIRTVHVPVNFNCYKPEQKH